VAASLLPKAPFYTHQAGPGAGAARGRGPLSAQHWYRPCPGWSGAALAGRTYCSVGHTQLL